jgi:hypothetical protein
VPANPRALAFKLVPSWHGPAAREEKLALSIDNGWVQERESRAGYSARYWAIFIPDNVMDKT